MGPKFEILGLLGLHGLPDSLSGVAEGEDGSDSEAW
jgi:hypothetical protein